jgi:hypothetical protein
VTQVSIPTDRADALWHAQKIKACDVMSQTDVKDHMRCVSEEAPQNTDDEVVPPCGASSVISDNVRLMSPASASTSALPLIACEVEPRNGISFLQDLLLKNLVSGITASPFLSSLDTMQTSERLHSMQVHGLEINEYKGVLLRLRHGSKWE